MIDDVIPLVGGEFAGRQVYDPQVRIHEDHAISVIRDRETAEFYLVNKDGVGIQVNARSSAFRSNAKCHDVREEDLR